MSVPFDSAQCRPFFSFFHSKQSLEQMTICLKLFLKPHREKREDRNEAITLKRSIQFVYVNKWNLLLNSKPSNEPVSKFQISWRQMVFSVFIDIRDTAYTSLVCNRLDQIKCFDTRLFFPLIFPPHRSLEVDE